MRLRDHPAVKHSGWQLTVDPRLLKIEPGFNVRDLDSPEERPALDMLKEQIRGRGVERPLEIRLKGEDLCITDGHRRHRVVMELIAEGEDILSVPAIAEPPGVNDAQRVSRLKRAAGGKPLTPLQDAEIVRRLQGYGWDRARIAGEWGCSEQNIRNLEETLALPEAVKQQVATGVVSASTARQVVRAEGADNAAGTIAAARETAQAKGRDRVTAKHLARKPAQPPAPAKSKPAAVRNLADVLIATLRDIALNGDGAKDRRQAARCLELQSIPLRAGSPFETFSGSRPSADEPALPFAGNAAERNAEIERDVLGQLSGSVSTPLASLAANIIYVPHQEISDALMRLIARGEAVSTEGGFKLPPMFKEREDAERVA